MEEKPDPKTTIVGRTKIRWDDSSMQSNYANVCNVAANREEVMVLFGTSQAWLDSQEEVSVTLSNRMILSPHAAKRLLVMLARSIEEYEKSYGPLDKPVAGA